MYRILSHSIAKYAPVKYAPVKFARQLCTTDITIFCTVEASEDLDIENIVYLR